MTEGSGEPIRAHANRRRRTAAPRSARLSTVTVLALPGILTLYFGFSSGGYFVAATGAAAAGLALVLVVRLTLAATPFGGVSKAGLLAASALAVYTIWTLASALWSGAPARALLEFDRALLYLLALVVLGSVPVSRRRLEASVRTFAAAVTVVCLAGLLSRVAPDLLSAPATAVDERLSYPVSYWNALGLLAAIGLLVCLHLASGARQPRSVRALGAAAIPPLAVTLLLTFSRGAIAAGLVALVLYLVLGRPWGLLGTALAVVPASVVALASAYRADLLATAEPTTVAAIAQGHDLAAVVVFCSVGAGVLRALLNGLDVRLEQRGERARAPGRGGRSLIVAGGVALAVAGLAVAVALDVPDRVGRQYERFLAGNSTPTSDVRERLTSPANNGRLGHWRVALEGFSRAPLIGQGAGTYQILWVGGRSSDFDAVDAHSLYLEVLAELGLVGLVLLAVALLTLLGRLATRARGRERSLYAVLVASMLAWAIHAGVDWDWEMPVVTAWLFGLGGLGIAARRGETHAPGPAPLTRIAAAIGCLILAVTPALAALSQERLDKSVAAFRRDDCTTSADAALDSIGFLSVRPQPYEVLAYCDVRAGRPRLAIAAVEKALARDPESWEYHYGMALVRAAAGLDPRPQAARALRLNPESPLTQDAVRRFATGDPAKCRTRASGARLPFEL